MPILEIDDIKLHYEVLGQGFPLLLLHGYGSSGDDWKHQLPDFTAHFQVITLDFRGHGQSDRPKGPYSIPEFAQDVIALLDKLHITQTHVLGFSMGGMVAFELAVHYPERVQNLIVVNSGPCLRFDVVNLFQYARSRVDYHFGGFSGLGKQLVKLTRQKSHQESFRQILKDRWGENDRSAMMATLRAFQGWNVEDQIEEIESPVLVITSDVDYISLAYKEKYTSRLSNATMVIIPDSHHRMLADNAHEFNDHVIKFLWGMYE